MSEKFYLVDEEKLKQLGVYYEEIAQTNQEYFTYWLENTFLHWDFWLSLSFSVIPWVLFILFRKKESTHRLLYVGLFAIIIASYLDFLGVVMGLWYYVGNVLPTIPPYVPWDFSIIPVFIMFLIQFQPEIKAYWKGLFFAGTATFIGEPFFRWLGFYVVEDWSKLYSFPIYFLFFLLCHKLSKVGKFEHI